MARRALGEGERGALGGERKEGGRTWGAPSTSTKRRQRRRGKTGLCGGLWVTRGALGVVCACRVGVWLSEDPHKAPKRKGSRAAPLCCVVSVLLCCEWKTMENNRKQSKTMGMNGKQSKTMGSNGKQSKTIENNGKQRKEGMGTWEPHKHNHKQANKQASKQPQTR